MNVKGTQVAFSKFETRVSEFNAFVQETKYDWTFTTHFEQGPDHPVVGINFTDAWAFCDWLTKHEQSKGTISATQLYRLPTNQEWDSASDFDPQPTPASKEKENGSNNAYPWGNAWPPPSNAGNFSAEDIPGYQDDYVYTAPVGKFSPSVSGLYDMAGNVWEWTSDESAGERGFVRGGSWAYFRKEYLRSDYRYEVPKNLRATTFGFRVVLEDRAISNLNIVSDQKKRAEEIKARMDKLAASSSTALNPEEKARMEALRRQLLGEPGGGTGEGGKVTVPDPKTLKAATSNEAYVNSLGNKFLPVQQTRLLAQETECRVADYEAFITETKREWPGRPIYKQDPSHPAAGMSHADATAYCDWLTSREITLKLIPSAARYRLPADAEWSILANLPPETGDTPARKSLAESNQFIWGTEWPPPLLAGNFDTDKMKSYQDHFTYTAPVASFLPNTAGFHDLAGNVAEWCSDNFDIGSAERVIRGGSWMLFEKSDLASAHRQKLDPASYRQDVGFRLILEIP